MATPDPQDTPGHVHPYNKAATPPVGKSATGKGTLALVLSATAFLTAPFLLLTPVFGFLPALLAGTGIVLAWVGLRTSTHGTGAAVTGLIVSVVLFALLAGIATMWSLVVTGPTIRDYQELHVVIDHIKNLIFGR